MLWQSQEWLEWAAYNIAVGVSESAVEEELLKSRLTEGEVSSFLSSLKSSPEFRAMKKLSRKYKLACDLNEALIAVESEVFNFSEISRMEGLSADEFLLKLYAANRPVILTDVNSKWPALEKWSLEFLSQTYGEEPIVYQNGRSADDHRDSFVDHTVKGTLSDYIKLIQNVLAGVNPPYLIAHDRLLDRASFKPLLNDVVFDERYLSPHGSHGNFRFLNTFDQYSSNDVAKIPPDYRLEASKELLRRARQVDALLDARPGLFITGIERIGGYPPSAGDLFRTWLGDCLRYPDALRSSRAS